MNTIFLFSGESLVYGFDDLTCSLQLSHKLVLSSKDYPGILVKYCQHFKGLSVLLQCSVCDQETILTVCFLSLQMSTHPYQQNVRESWQNTWGKNLAPVVQRPISPNPGLNFNPAFFISLFKSLLGKIFPILFRTSNDQIASKKIWPEFSLKVFRPEIKFHTNPGLP